MSSSYSHMVSKCCCKYLVSTVDLAWSIPNSSTCRLDRYTNHLFCLAKKSSTDTINCEIMSRNCAWETLWGDRKFLRFLISSNRLLHRAASTKSLNQESNMSLENVCGISAIHVFNLSLVRLCSRFN